ELELAHALVGGLKLRSLLPGGGHERFLVLLDDAGSERRRGAPARIEIQLVEPGRAGRIRDRCSGVPAAIRRRGQEWVGGRNDRLNTARLIDDRGERLLEVERNRIGRGWRWWTVRRLGWRDREERALHLRDGGPRRREARFADVDRARADAVGYRWLQGKGEGLEVSLRAGAKLPV